MMYGAALTLHISGLSVRTPEQQTGEGTVRENSGRLGPDLADFYTLHMPYVIHADVKKVELKR